MRRLLALSVVATSACGLGTPAANDPHGQLVRAARHGDVATIRRLAASGIDLDASPATALWFVFPDFDHFKWTALQHAAGKHQVEAVRVLLEWGADPDAMTDGGTPLLIAAGSKDPTMMQLLLDAGADVNQTMATEAWAEVNEPPGPLSHLIEHVFGAPSPTDVQQRIRAIAAQSRP